MSDSREGLRRAAGSLDQPKQRHKRRRQFPPQRGRRFGGRANAATAWLRPQPRRRGLRRAAVFQASKQSARSRQPGLRVARSRPRASLPERPLFERGRRPPGRRAAIFFADFRHCDTAPSSSRASSHAARQSVHAGRRDRAARAYRPADAARRLCSSRRLNSVQLIFDMRHNSASPKTLSQLPARPVKPRFHRPFGTAHHVRDFGATEILLIEQQKTETVIVPQLADGRLQLIGEVPRIGRDSRRRPD